jgi:ElaB/YqjD/DUF883 family membrane-anchored ribosome-binding protein
MPDEETIHEATSDAKAQIAQLRKQVETLMSERVTPALADAAGKVEATAKHATDVARDQAELLSKRVQDQPLIALGIAAALGFLLGRIAR